MKKRVLIILTLFALLVNAQAQKSNNSNPLDNAAIDYLNQSFKTYNQLQKNIWSNPELGFLEDYSSGLLQEHLRENGFKVEHNLAGMPTAFVATYGSGGPVIGILAEFDALPGLSQDTVPYRAPLEDGGSGHGCGHNTFGVGSVAGAVAIKKWLDQNNHEGTVKVFGTPAEEGGGGKVYMVREGLFDDVDVVLDWHPGSRNAVSVGTGTAIQMVDYTFHGVAAHAAGNPDKGRSALDGVEAFNYMVNMLREHVPISSRIHYVITDGGDAPNIVPHYAKVSYYIRSPERNILKELKEWIDQAAEGAAKGTQTTVTSEIISGFYERLNNRTLAEAVQKNLELVGGIEYNDREREFAEAMIKESNLDLSILKDAEEIKPLAEEKPSTGGGSSDVGDVSWVVPTISFNTATFVPGSPGHSWQNVASGGTTIGTKALLNTAKVFSLTAIDLFSDPELTRAAIAEFEERRGEDFEYVPLLGDRAPALDYRLKP